MPSTLDPASWYRPPLAQLFPHRRDIGPVLHPGSTTFNPATQCYTLSGAGKNMWLGTDEFHFASTRISGDFILTARVRFLGTGVDPHRKLGLHVRPSDSLTSPHATAVIHGDGLTSLQFRRTPAGPTEELKSPLTAPSVIQLERRGGTFLLSVAHPGDLWTTTQLDHLALPNDLDVGLFVCSHNVDVVERAEFDNVRLVLPAPSSLVPYRDYLSSVLEVLDVDTGLRRAVHFSPTNLEAPNWTPDGKTLIYNAQGRLYAFDLASGSTREIPTAFATRNNNDHVLSFDGKQLGISHHVAEEGGKSAIFTLPSTGGTPTRITPNTPSYLHGWSPDGKFLVYTAERGDGNYDIYRIPADGSGPEVRLTTAPGLDDGSEYSPDGKHIYFNSVRTGNMQLFRMSADGTDQTPLTSDELNNWFPHISPDNRRIVFLSYLDPIAPSDHPYYKRCALRTFPVTGGSPKVLAFLYGGQGTINVPSWAPDSRHIAFVSHTGLLPRA